MSIRLIRFAVVIASYQCQVEALCVHVDECRYENKIRSAPIAYFHVHCICTNRNVCLEN